MKNSDFVTALREAAPYINEWRSQTFVLALSSRLFGSPAFLPLVQDIALLNTLGLRLILLYGVRSRLTDDAALFCQQLRVTDAATLERIKALCGQMHADLTAALGISCLATPHSAKRLMTSSGNMLLAKPIGVIDGMDMQFTGQLRHIDVGAIEHALADRRVVMIGPIAASLTGQVYNLDMPTTAAAVAAAVSAEKLIFLGQNAAMRDQTGHILPNLSLAEAKQWQQNVPQSPEVARYLNAANSALNAGVARVQLIDATDDGSLLVEIFSRDGIGTSIAPTSFSTLRQAQAADIPAILHLVRPLMTSGYLMPRAAADFEKQIDEFFILEYDQLIVGCAALHRFEGMDDIAEIACLAVAGDTRHLGYGDWLLEHIEKTARQAGIRRLLALTTQAEDWFLERRFHPTTIDTLPSARQKTYHHSGRHSKILIKNL